MPVRPLKSHCPIDDELLQQDLPTLGRILRTHLSSTPPGVTSQSSSGAAASSPALPTKMLKDVSTTFEKLELPVGWPQDTVRVSVDSIKNR